MTSRTAVSTRSAASARPMWRSISAPDRMSAVGLALLRPAYLGAEPWTASNTAASGPMFAPGATPKPPTRPAARSLMMSPYRFGRTSTSYCSGFWTSCMHMLSTMRSSNSTRPSNCAATVRHDSRNSPGQLHDVRLVDRGDLPAAVSDGVVEGEAGDQFGRLAGDDLDALGGIATHPM